MAANDTAWPHWVREGAQVIAARDGVGRSRSTETVKWATITRVTRDQFYRVLDDWDLSTHKPDPVLQVI